MTLENGAKVIALDFDGVLHDYHGWNEGKLAGPIPGMKELVERLEAAGAEVVVFTTRTPAVVKGWLITHGFSMLEVRNDKWSRIDVFVDDRAWEFNPALVEPDHVEEFAQALLGFEPYWRLAPVDRLPSADGDGLK